ncbi:MAG: hypothetical protein AAFN41_07275 [Planctomycetota bacterium]
MTTSEHTFNQVRNILGRLDRSIDEARDKRLNGGEEPEAAREESPAADDARHVPAREPEPRRSSEAPPPPVGPRRASNRAPSPFGRAKPLRRTGDA